MVNPSEGLSSEELNSLTQNKIEQLYHESLKKPRPAIFRGTHRLAPDKKLLKISGNMNNSNVQMSLQRIEWAKY